jgi:predicted TPR repeat methyltransferase
VTTSDIRPPSMAEGYDEGAEASVWLAPEVAFGLAYIHVEPGQSVLDLGIGTGLGSILFHKAGLRVHGMDISKEMLDVCQRKGFTADLQQHDLCVTPYPYTRGSMDHAVCVGVLNFFEDLRPVFREVGRILRDGGLFVFVVADRNAAEQSRMIVGPEHTQADVHVTMYRHSVEQIEGWLQGSGFGMERSLEFVVYMDRRATVSLPAKAYLARKTGAAPSAGQ